MKPTGSVGITSITNPSKMKRINPNFSSKNLQTAPEIRDRQTETDVIHTTDNEYRNRIRVDNEFYHIIPEQSCEKQASDRRNGGRVQEVTHRHDEPGANLQRNCQLSASYISLCNYSFPAPCIIVLIAPRVIEPITVIFQLCLVSALHFFPIASLSIIVK